ncbi:hypothetical protein ACFVFT_38280 [Streptomyces tendae]|uniref:hypothetical protein n=1 Tax=Streptomyces tendae TaxID=1932 RepID=UPI0036B78D9C
MTDRERAARLADESSDAERFSLLLEEALGSSLPDAFLEQRRTLKRILEKVFLEKSRHESLRTAIKTVIDHADADDWAIHFSTGTSYRVQVKSRRPTHAVTARTCCSCSDAVSTDVLDAPLHPLPPSERAARLLRMAKLSLFNPPSTVPKFPLRRQREKVGHLAVAVKDRGQYQGVFRVADESGADEIHRYVSSSPETLSGELDAWELRTFTIIADPESGMESAAAVIEPFKTGSLSHSSEVARALDIDLLLCLDGGASE